MPRWRILEKALINCNTGAFNLKLKTMKSIYLLKLNEQTTQGVINITRVPGGWIYIINNSNPIFIQMNYEFENINLNLNINPERVIESVRKSFNLPKDWLLKKSRKGNIPLAKMIICKILTDKLHLRQFQISDLLNYKTHSSVINSLSTINKELTYNKKTIEWYVKILKLLNLE